MKKILIIGALLVLCVGICISIASSANEPVDNWTEIFNENKTDLVSSGTNPYFILEPGYYLKLKGTDGNEEEELTITVLDETKKVDGVETRIVEERETKNKQLVEVSRNYFAISKRTNSVYYFGEDVDIYRDGKVVSHDGAWLSGKNGARYGLMIPGTVLLASRYYQEIAPKVAMDRAEIISMTETIEIPWPGIRHNLIFKNKCLKIEETTPLEPGSKGYKYYAPGVGLIKDGSLTLVDYSGIEKK